MLPLVHGFYGLSLMYVTGWTITDGPIARLVHLWAEQMLCMVLLTISYYYSAELQISLPGIESGSSDEWHFRVANGYLLLV